jgi:hypothetical protein
MHTAELTHFSKLIFVTTCCLYDMYLVHCRVGRTARAGKRGHAISLVSQYDVELVHNIEEVCKTLDNNKTCYYLLQAMLCVHNIALRCAVPTLQM